MGGASQRWDAAGAGVGVGTVGVGVGLDVGLGVGVMVGVGVGLGVHVGVGVAVGVKVWVGVAVNVAVPHTCGSVAGGVAPKISRATNPTMRISPPTLCARLVATPTAMLLRKPGSGYGAQEIRSVVQP
jgi:hypothetical protein